MLTIQQIMFIVGGYLTFQYFLPFFYDMYKFLYARINPLLQPEKSIINDNHLIKEAINRQISLIHFILSIEFHSQQINQMC